MNQDLHNYVLKAEEDEEKYWEVQRGDLGDHLARPGTEPYRAAHWPDVSPRQRNFRV
jgi:hypothetical protein